MLAFRTTVEPRTAHQIQVQVGFGHLCIQKNDQYLGEGDKTAKYNCKARGVIVLIKYSTSSLRAMIWHKALVYCGNKLYND